MNKLLLAIFALIFVGCSSTPKNLDQYKREVEKYYDEGHYGIETYEVIQDAISELDKMSFGPKAAAIFDVDETALSNYEHIKVIDFGWEREIWDEWLKEANAENIPQVKKLYEYLVERKVKIIFLTSRYENTCDATHKNLVDEGYKDFDTLICRDASTKGMTSREFKEQERIRLVEKEGYNIVATVGDQWSDLEGKYSGYRVKIPNYLYIVD